MDTFGVRATGVTLKLENVRFHLDHNEQAGQGRAEWESGGEQNDVSVCHHEFQVIIEKFNFITLHFSHFLLNNRLLDRSLSFLSLGGFLKQLSLNLLLQLVLILKQIGHNTLQQDSSNLINHEQTDQIEPQIGNIPLVKANVQQVHLAVGEFKNESLYEDALVVSRLVLVVLLLGCVAGH